MDVYIVYLASIIDCYISVYIIFDYFRSKYCRTHLKTWPYSFASILISLIIGSINVLHIPLFNFVSWIIFLTIAISFLYYDPWKGRKHLFFNLYCLLFLLTFFETMGIMIYNLFFLFINQPLPDIANEIFRIAITKILIICLYHLNKNKTFIKDNNNQLPKKQMVLYLSLSFFSVINICLNARMIYSTESEHDKFLGYLSIIIIVLVNLYIMKLFDYIIENHNLKAKISLSEQQATMQLNYYEHLNANYQKSLQVIHDVDKHINTLEQLYKNTEYETANDYIRGIDKLISNFVLTPYCSNMVLNIILNDKKNESKKKGIQFSCVIDHVDFNFMDNIDITTIFSNLLDNSLKASALCTEKKEISVTVCSHNNFIIINIKNSCDQYNTSGMLSSNEYGTGLFNVENSAKKYDGFLKLTYSPKDFTCNVILNNM